MDGHYNKKKMMTIYSPLRFAILTQLAQISERERVKCVLMAAYEQ